VKEIEGPVTRSAVEALLLGEAKDPTSVAEVPHPGFNADDRNGGYAFVYDDRFLIQNYDGSRQIFFQPGDHADQIDKIEKRWLKIEYRNRALSLDDVSALHRAAIAALVDGATSVADLPLEARVGITEIAVADGLLVRLRRRTRDTPTEAAALQAIAANDSLLRVQPGPWDAYPCPVCGRPSVGHPWLDVASVCDDCAPKAACSEGRRVTGINIDFSGGFKAIHLDDHSVCDEVTRDGHVRVDDHDCLMGEAKFGGVFVGVHRAKHHTN